MRLFLALAIVPCFALGVSAQEGARRIVTLGDSITKGVRPGVKAEETFAQLLQKALARENIATEVVNVGIGGERTDQALKRLDAVIKLKPAIVTIMYGTNDSYVDPGKNDSRITPEQYRANLAKIVADLRKAGIEPILMTEPRWGDKAKKNGLGEHPNVRLKRYVQVCRDVARDTRTPLVDHYAHWTKQNANGIDIGTWTTDQCHPNPRGHQEITQTMVPTVRAALQKK